MSDLSIAPEDETKKTYDSGPSAAKLEQAMRDIKAKQSLGMAIAGGFAASVIAAFIWAAITYLTQYQIGYMAIGVGVLVGFAVRFFGKGIDIQFGIVGGAFALFGCLLGNLLTVIISAALVESVSVIDMVILFITNPAIVIAIYQETFSPIDLLFYGIAIYAGFRYGIMEVTEDDLGSEPPPPVPGQV